MHSYQIPNLRFSGIAGEALPQHAFVSVNAEGKIIKCADSATAQVIGVTNTDAKINEVVDMYDGITQVIAGATLNPGDYIKVSQGKAVKGEASTAVAVAFTKAIENEIITVKLV